MTVDVDQFIINQQSMHAMWYVLLTFIGKCMESKIIEALLLADGMLFPPIKYILISVRIYLALAIRRDFFFKKSRLHVQLSLLLSDFCKGFR